MPVADVRAVLVADSPIVRDSLISAHIDHLETELAKTQAAVNSLRALLDSPAGLQPVHRRAESSFSALLSPKTPWTRQISKPGGVRP